MERMNAEGVFFHRGCLKCDFCLCGLRVNNYSCERSATGQGKVKVQGHHRSRAEVTQVKVRSRFKVTDRSRAEVTHRSR